MISRRSRPCVRGGHTPWHLEFCGITARMCSDHVRSTAPRQSLPPPSDALSAVPSDHVPTRSSLAAGTRDDRWFDRVDLGLRKSIVDVQFVAAMNHKSGSFSVNPRLQRHFVAFGCQTPGDDDLATVSCFRVLHFGSSSIVLVSAACPLGTQPSRLVTKKIVCARNGKLT